MIANVDGSSERELTAKQLQDDIIALSLSPDGGHIALDSKSSEGGSHSDLVEISTSNAMETRIGPKYMGVRRSLVWLPDGSGLATTQGAIHGSKQLWFVPYPDGEPRRITNDANDYGEISVSADSKTLSVTQVRKKTRLWVAPAGDPGLAKEITTTAASGSDTVSTPGPTQGAARGHVPHLEN